MSENKTQSSEKQEKLSPVEQTVKKNQTLTVKTDTTTKNENTGNKSEGNKSESFPTQDGPKAAPTTAKKSLWKSVKAANVTSTDAAASSDSADEKTTLKSVAQRVNRQIKAMTLIKQWTQMTSHSQFSNDQEHLTYMRNVAKHATIDLPDGLVATVREEVLPILQDTLKQYKMELGANHSLTQEMQNTIQRFSDEKNSTSAKELKANNNFFRRMSNMFLPVNDDATKT